MVIDLSKLDAKTRGTVDHIFRKDFDLAVLKAIKRQTAIAARNALHRPRAKEHFGPRVFEIDATIDGIWRSFYGHNYSDDADLMKFLLKRNPEIGVRGAGTRIQSGYAPGDQSKFRKKYRPNVVTEGRN